MVQLANDNLPAEDAAKLAAGAEEPDVFVIREGMTLPEYNIALNSADIALFPYETIPYCKRTSGVFGEAVAYGKPVVVSPGTWMAEQIASGRAAGTIAEDMQPESFARAIARCVADLTPLQQSARAVSDEWRRTMSLSAFVDLMDAEIARRALEERPARRSWWPFRRQRPENMDGRELTPEAIEAGEHRAFVGGLWDEIGKLQFDFMLARGLRPEHRLADVGCGALRGGVHFVRYLDAGHYYGIDINRSLPDAGRKELMAAGLNDRGATLAVSGDFDLSRFGVPFDYALAVSLFTHLSMPHIARCLVEVNRALKPGGAFYATFFEAPHPAHASDITHTPGGIITHLDSDPFHYAFTELRDCAERAGMAAELLGEWQHPRDQRMVCFFKPS